MQQKVALVTGASRGIGRCIAMQLAKAGMVVLGTATTEAGASAITQAFLGQQLKGRGYVLDLNQKEGLEVSLSAMRKDWGDITVLVNNAGITRDTLCLRMNTDHWDDVLTTNLRSVFLLSKACLRDMLKSKWGRIIAISSVVGFTGNAGQVNYAAAKAGLSGLTKSLALEVANRGITVNLVAPGFIETDMTKQLPAEQREALLGKIPMNNLGQPDDVASAVKFLVSEEARYITGQSLHVNGGMYMA